MTVLVGVVAKFVNIELLFNFLQEFQRFQNLKLGLLISILSVWFSFIWKQDVIAIFNPEVLLTVLTVCICVLLLSIPSHVCIN